VERVLGIDLGTTNSVVAYMRRGEPQTVLNRENRELTPSVVGRGKRGDLLVGASARGRAAIDPENTIYSVKRFMGRRFDTPEVAAALAHVAYRVEAGPDGDVSVGFDGRTYSPIEISALILRRLKEDAEDRVHERFTRAVITVPAYFGERQVAATREAGHLAGFHVLRIINEPTAASLAYGLAREQQEDARTILVYDLGGGTFDISILLLMQGAFTVMGVEGDNLLGGDDFDRALIERILRAVREETGTDVSGDHLALQQVRAAAEEVKITLSSQLTAEVVLPVLGRSGVSLTLEVSRAEFETMIRPHLERTIELTRKAVADADLTIDAIDQVLLVGGSTAIPLVEELLAEMFGADRIRKDVNPMQCVALGAAIQSALVTDLECPKCLERAPVAETACPACSAPLTGRERVACPTCHLPSDAGSTECGRCGGALSQAAFRGTAPATAPARAPACPRCGKPYAPGARSCSICGEVVQERGGLRCPACGTIGAQGEGTCASCGADVATPPFEVTPKDLGIELQDGRMAVIVPKGTSYPTPDPVSRDFATSVPGQRRLEIAVYEGPHQLAQRNELCGHVTLPLPESTARGTAINVSFGLAEDRTLTVAVRIRAAGVAGKTVRLQHFGRLDPERQQHVEERRERLTAFLDRWADELEEAESRAFYELIDEMDQLLLGQSGGQPVDALLTRADELARAAATVRGSTAYISAVKVAAGKYLAQEDREELDRYLESMEQARARADWTAARAIADNARAAIDGYGEAVEILVICRTLANQGRLSPSLTHRVRGAVRTIDQGLTDGQPELAERGMGALLGLWDEVKEELAEDDRLPAITKPDEWSA
jgi:molecular chaperone DnaK (HSP70)